MSAMLYMLRAIAMPTSNHGQWNRSGRPGDRRTNVCSMVPESLADAISEVLNSNFSMLHMDNRLLGRVAGLPHDTDYGIFV